MGQLNYATAPAQSVPTSDPTDVSKKAASTEFVQNVVPPGVVFPYAGPIPPSGWLLADGSEVSRTTYARLFAAIGTTYGAGNGATTFNLPDLRGEFIRGLDNARGVDAGRGLGSAQLDALQNIAGSAGFRPADGSAAGAGTGSNMSGPFSYSTKAGAGGASPVQLGGTGKAADVLFFNASNVARTSTETRPRNIAMNFIIKAQ